MDVFFEIFELLLRFLADCLLLVMLLWLFLIIISYAEGPKDDASGQAPE